MSWPTMIAVVVVVAGGGAVWFSVVRLHQMDVMARGRGGVYCVVQRRRDGGCGPSSFPRANLNLELSQNFKFERDEDRNSYRTAEDNP